MRYRVILRKADIDEVRYNYDKGYAVILLGSIRRLDKALRIAMAYDKGATA